MSHYYMILTALILQLAHKEKILNHLGVSSH